MTELIFDNKKGRNPALAVQCFIQGIRFLGKKELRSYLIIPILINLVLFVSAFSLGIYYISDLIHAFIPSWLDWLRWVLYPLFFISFLMTGFFTFTLLANLIASPFYGKLAETTLSLISGQVIRADEQKIAKVIFSELKRLFYLLTRALPLLVLFIIPGINLIAPFLWVLYSAWGMALEYMAYPLENEAVLFADQRQLLKSVRVGALSFGGIVILGLTLPVLNILVPPAAVIGATIYAYRLDTTNG